MKDDCRLLYLVGGLGAGGLERQLYLLLRAMDRDRYRPHVVVWRFHGDDLYVSRIRELGVPLHFFPDTQSTPRRIQTLRRILQQLTPEVIHSYSFYTNFAAWLATLETNRIVIGCARSDFFYERKISGVLLGRLCARWPDVQIYNSFVGAKNSRNSLTLFAPRRVFVVRNGLDLAQFKKLPVPTNGRCRIVGIGSLVQIKRWDRLLSAAMQLKQTGVDFTVEIAGSGPLRNSLQEQAQALNVQDRVKFIGHVDDVPQLLASATFLAHTSDVEGCPNVVMEAMACGRAVIATDAGDVPALVEDGKTGFVVERGKDAKFSEQMANLIRNRELCSQMGKAGRIKAEQNFGLTRFVDETLAAYRLAGWRAC